MLGMSLPDDLAGRVTRCGRMAQPYGHRIGGSVQWRDLPNPFKGETVQWDKGCIRETPERIASMSDTAASILSNVELPALPPAVPPPLPLGEVNGSVILYSGPVNCEVAGTTISASGRIRLNWLPSPRIRFDVRELPRQNYTDLPDIGIRLDDGTLLEGCCITGMTNAWGWPGHETTARGTVNAQVVRPHDGQARYAVFLLPNFEDMKGSAIAYPDGSLRAARLILHAGGWKITLDETSDFDEARKSLKSNSGFAVTHIGRVEREDGTTFSGVEAWTVLNALGWYCSFCCGRWTGPCLPHGFDGDGRQVWVMWDHFRTAPCATRLMWMDAIHPGTFEVPFSGFLKKWSDETWQDVVRVAIHWYVEANAQAGSIEGAIVLTQTAFELLSSAVLVERFKWLSTDGYEKLAAADRIRLLFHWAGIPTDIPAECTSLAQTAKADGWPDSPTAMTLIRNTITHPTLKNRAKFGRHPQEVRTDAWVAGLWSLELCLLRLFDYGGVYGSRLKNRWSGQVTRVPWAPEEAATGAESSLGTGAPPCSS